VSNTSLLVEVSPVAKARSYSSVYEMISRAVLSNKLHYLILCVKRLYTTALLTALLVLVLLDVLFDDCPLELEEEEEERLFRGQ